MSTPRSKAARCGRASACEARGPVFGISFAKIIVLVAVIAIVWFGFKYLQRFQAMGGTSQPAAPKRAASGQPREAVEPATQDMIACRVCGTYVAANTKKSCGRADCVYGR